MNNRFAVETMFCAICVLSLFFGKLELTSQDIQRQFNSVILFISHVSRIPFLVIIAKPAKVLYLSFSS